MPKLPWNAQNRVQLEEQVLSGGPVVLQGALNNWSLPYSDINALARDLGDREVWCSSGDSDCKVHVRGLSSMLAAALYIGRCLTRATVGAS